MVRLQLRLSMVCQRVWESRSLKVTLNFSRPTMGVKDSSVTAILFSGESKS